MKQFFPNSILNKWLLWFQRFFAHFSHSFLSVVDDLGWWKELKFWVALAVDLKQELSGFGTEVTLKPCRVLGISSVQSLSHVWFSVTPWNAAYQASLSITNSQSLLKRVSVESVMPSNHLIFSHPLLLPSLFPSIRVFSNESVLLGVRRSQNSSHRALVGTGWSGPWRELCPAAEWYPLILIVEAS